MSRSRMHGIYTEGFFFCCFFKLAYECKAFLSALRLRGGDKRTRLHRLSVTCPSYGLYVSLSAPQRSFWRARYAVKHLRKKKKKERKVKQCLVTMNEGSRGSIVWKMNAIWDAWVRGCVCCGEEEKAWNVDLTSCPDCFHSIFSRV